MFFDVEFEFNTNKKLSRVIEAKSLEALVQDLSSDNKWYQLGESDVFQLVNLEQVTNINIKNYVKE